MNSCELRFTVMGTPQPQGSMKHVGGGRMIHKPELIDWRNKVLDTGLIVAKQTGWTIPYDGPVILGCTFYLPRPKRARFDVPAVKPDLDKLMRAIQDSLAPHGRTGLLTEDSRIWGHINPAKLYSEKPGMERVEIVLIQQYVPF